MVDVTTRLDNMEMNIKKDIQSILEILQLQQQQHQQQQQQQQTLLLQQQQQQLYQRPAELFQKSSDDLQRMHDELHHAQSSQLAGASGSEKQNLLLATSCQPSGSDYSFELLALDAKQEMLAHQQKPFNVATTSQVHRSISQPECTDTAADKSLLRCVFTRCCCFLFFFLLCFVFAAPLLACEINFLHFPLI